jgi:phosphate acetyltransferase
MSAVMDSILSRAQQVQKVVGLPEAGDPRTILAARQAHDDRLADIVLVGSRGEAASAASEGGARLDDIRLIDPGDDDVRQRCAKLLYKLRQAKGMTQDEAWEAVLDPLYCAACLLKLGELDATVAGAAHATSAVLRPLLQIVKTAAAYSTVSSSFIMETPNPELGEGGALVFGDCGVMPNPTVEQLADIAIMTAESAQLYLQAEPRVAMLSFSTNGSAKHPDVEKVRAATKLAQEKAPQFVIDGEMQADAALAPTVATAKFPGSPVAGRANVLIFPDLDAGNIGYKLVQRLAGAGAYGPLVQGLSRTGLDLSRGATPHDIYNVVALASLRAEHFNEPAVALSD